MMMLLRRMSYQHILFEAAGGVARITINRPEKLNALNAATLGELDDAFARAESDPAVRALLLTGAGEKAFAAGADIQELAESTPIEAHWSSLRGQRIFRRLETMPKPSLAAINGFALGGGLELALCCAVRVASENARLGLPEIRLGLIPGYGGTQRLARLVGRGRALEMMLTGEPVNAAEAHRIGLVNHVVPHPELLGFSLGLLDRIAANAPLAAGFILGAVETGMSSGLEEGLRFEAAAFGLAAATQDWREGTRAFLEKRKPEFAGN